MHPKCILLCCVTFKPQGLCPSQIFPNPLNMRGMACANVLLAVRASFNNRPRFFTNSYEHKRDAIAVAFDCLACICFSHIIYMGIARGIFKGQTEKKCIILLLCLFCLRNNISPARLRPKSLILLTKLTPRPADPKSQPLNRKNLWLCFEVFTSVPLMGVKHIVGVIFIREAFILVDFNLLIYYF